MADDFTLNELARTFERAMTRVEDVAQRLESGQFVRSDVFDVAIAAINKAVAQAEMDIHKLEDTGASKDMLTRTDERVNGKVSNDTFGDLARRVHSLESTQTWLIRLVVAVVITAVLALVVGQGGSI